VLGLDPEHLEGARRMGPRVEPEDDRQGGLPVGQIGAAGQLAIGEAGQVRAAADLQRLCRQI